MTHEFDIFDWQRHPEAENWLMAPLDKFVVRVRPLRRLSKDMLVHAGTCLVDWIDHIVLADGDRPRSQLADLGFATEEVPAGAGDTIFHHPGTIFPRVVLRSGTPTSQGDAVGVALQVERIDHFLSAQHLVVPTEGSPLSPYRRAGVWKQHKGEVLIVERRGHSGFLPVDMPPDYPDRYLRAYDQWAGRPRLFPDERAGMEHTLALARSLVSSMGTDSAAWIAFSAERAQWEQRNRAGQVQRAQQDSLPAQRSMAIPGAERRGTAPLAVTNASPRPRRFATGLHSEAGRSVPSAAWRERAGSPGGLGWANHDHHTFRSSRDAFPLLIQILEAFGFRSRERFYAGEEAGWGAQVMEQPVCRLAVFADVDLSPEEVESDFVHRPLASREGMGTVGLWCALHGEAMLGAGLHHLACRSDLNAVTAGLAERDMKMMRPFSDFPYLRQAFTQGERWSVTPDRLNRLAASGQITESQHIQLAENGAIGSHLESIQRGEGFKGFNQQTISDIIRRTDPRGEMRA